MHQFEATMMVSWGLDTMKMSKLTQVSRAKVAGGQITETVPSTSKRSGWTVVDNPTICLSRKNSFRQGQVNVYRYIAFVTFSALFR